jgi:hypothetical protein
MMMDGVDVGADADAGEGQGPREASEAAAAAAAVAGSGAGGGAVPLEDHTWVYGWALLAATYVGFCASLYALVVSKWMPLTGNAVRWPQVYHTRTACALLSVGCVCIQILDWVAQDHYYCYLLPATLPVAVYVVVWNWMSLKFFRHN